MAEAVVKSIVDVLWGPEIKQEVFERWKQGFVFGDVEPTALIQYDGGPCAVIVPVQAFLLKNLLFSEIEQWRQTNGAMRDQLLCEAMADILCQITASDESSQLCVCHISGDDTSIAPDVSVIANHCGELTNNQSSTQEGDLHGFNTCDQNSASSLPDLHFEKFHSLIVCRCCKSREELVTVLRSQLTSFTRPCGVLLFLYSVILTKGVGLLKNETADISEPLIDSVHGHGSQSLINLLLTGKAVSHVWDNDKDVSGLKLKGISSRSEIGFLTLLEHLRYCEVGWYLKNPKNPIWLLASETHLTLLFSLDRMLVGDESEHAVVQRTFRQFDEDGRGFIATESLGELMKALELVSEPEYVRLMADKLDPEQLGIITFNSFIDEFYPASASDHDTSSKAFSVYHYNGLQRSQNKVEYSEGRCVIHDMEELQMMCDYSAIKTCLMTKWPTIELQWTNTVTPSIN